MHIDDLFHSPADRLKAFAQAQLHLYKHDPSLQDYFLPLQSYWLKDTDVNSNHQAPYGRLLSWAGLGTDKVIQLRPRKKIKADVLFCPMPYFSRASETRFLVRTLLGLAQTDAKILCLLSAGAPCQAELDAKLAAMGRSGQVTFLDPAAASSPIERRLRSMVARIRGRSIFEKGVQILEPYRLTLNQEIESGFEHTAYFVELWERLAPYVEFDAVVARCHWHTLCSPVCRTARERGKPVITFQQGVICHTLDAPVTASKYVAFGPTSASFLSHLNRRFFQEAGVPEPAVDYVSGGCLYDMVTNLPDQFDNQTLLMVDVPAGQSDFYGVEGQCRAMLELAEKLLTAELPLRRLIIRPHPYWNDLDFEACKRLVREYPTKCELSHPSWSLEDDLRRSSAVIGIFSGVLTVASACGLPTIFLQTEQGYTTGDLACFSPRQTLLPEAAFIEISRILSDRNAYADARMQVLRNAREYYAKGTNLDIDGPFFDGLLQATPRANHAQNQQSKRA